jgi:hypothetical protein
MQVFMEPSPTSDKRKLSVSFCVRFSCAASLNTRGARGLQNQESSSRTKARHALDAAQRPAARRPTLHAVTQFYVAYQADQHIQVMEFENTNIIRG